MAPTVSSSIRRSTARSLASYLKSSQSSRRHVPPTAHCSNSPAIAATDPNHTARLWRSVMSYSGTAPWTSSSASVFTTSVLEPHGITIEEFGANQNLGSHFNIEHLPVDPSARLDHYKSQFPSRVWVQPDMECVRTEYDAMYRYRMNEAEHRAYALYALFLDEPRYPGLLEGAGDLKWLPSRMIKLEKKPDKRHWQSPPPVTPPSKSFDWDVCPDCAYHVSLQAFSPAFRRTIKHHVASAQERAVCPYFTIEFKKDGEGEQTAMHHLAVASSIALYNRFCLKAVTRQLGGKKWSADDREQMRHYALTFCGSLWDLYCMVPKTFGFWTGCTMQFISVGDCYFHQDVEKQVGVINDVHYWGLAVHGQSCEQDIVDKICSFSGADMSGIMLMKE
ncbi:hypothetical protein K491DRAFT_699635 [Lophiostoma macrostomum CBS 122681]|uniref:Uncharacterized protein n=1 Tax=Lophiostoma macrostomum CBS 122681 TaxID=1314788 RepID=A0A6A6SIP2_9PLEO|nr:hypothetical protein K491DRAFT_699635 [Lophiostoma macrostomum CBS 122681]